MPSLVVYKAFFPTQPGEEQNLEGLKEPSGRPKRTISCTRGRGMTDGIKAKVSILGLVAMWDSMKCKTLFWVTTIHPPTGHTRPRMWGPHFQLGNGSDIICHAMPPCA